MNNYFINKIHILYPKTRIDIGINFILDNFQENTFQKIFNLFKFEKNDYLLNKEYNLQDINNLYKLSEFSLYIVKIILDNPCLLNNYFLKDMDIYNLYGESNSYFMIIKIKLLVLKNFVNEKKHFNKFRNYLGNIEKLFNLYLSNYKDFFQKNINPEKKRNILLDIYIKSLTKSKKNIFILFWLIDQDIKYNIFEKYQNIEEYEKYRYVQKISDIFLKKIIDKNDIREIDDIQNKYKVIENYKLFKEDFLFLY